MRVITVLRIQADDRMRRTFLTRILYSDYSCLCMYLVCITMSVTQNAVCNSYCEIKSIFTYLLTYLTKEFLNSEELNPDTNVIH